MRLKQPSVLYPMDESYKQYLANKDKIDKEIDSMFLRYQPMFEKTYFIEDGYIGVAQYLALLAYPTKKESSEMIKYFSSMISAYCRINDKDQYKVFESLPEELQKAQLLKKPWKNIDQTIGKGTRKLGKRLQAYHTYAAYTQAILNGSNKSFEELLSWSSQAYESKRSKMQDEKHRLENLKRTIHRPSRPVYHLIHGYYEEHLIHYPVCKRHPVTALKNSSWLEKAIILARRRLACELVDYHYNDKGLQKPLKVKFEPSEVVHIELASKPLVGISC